MGLAYSRPAWAAQAFARLANGTQSYSWASIAELEAAISYANACSPTGGDVATACLAEIVRRHSE